MTGDGYSFPSGDAMCCSCFASSLSICYNNKLFYLISLLSLGRVYYGFH